jgi:pimeloyl-ACP methyl ester carboxylesterase
MSWYWHGVTPLLERSHHEAIAIDLPSDDARVSLNDYAEIVIRAIGKRTNVTLIAQSFGGFTAAMVCARVAVRGLIFVNTMIPNPGETAGAWWANTGAVQARVAAARRDGYNTDFDLQTYFLHDVPDAVLRSGPARQREQADTVFGQRCEFNNWPKVPIRVIAAANDRFFPLEFQRQVARTRLAKEVEVIPGGHLVALSHPNELAALLLR